MIQHPTPKALALRHLEVCRHTIGVSDIETPGHAKKYLSLFGQKRGDVSTAWLMTCLMQAWCDLNAIGYHPQNSAKVFAGQIDAVSEAYCPVSSTAQAMVAAATEKGIVLKTETNGAAGWLAILGAENPLLAIVDNVSTEGVEVIQFGAEGVERRLAGVSDIRGFIATYEVPVPVAVASKAK